MKGRIQREGGGGGVADAGPATTTGAAQGTVAGPTVPSIGTKGVRGAHSEDQKV